MNVMAVFNYYRAEVEAKKPFKVSLWFASAGGRQDEHFGTWDGEHRMIALDSPERKWPEEVYDALDEAIVKQLKERKRNGG